MVLLIGAALVTMVSLSRHLYRKALRDLVSLFRELGATSSVRAAAPDELGLTRGSPFDRMFRLRDYRPQALRVLGQANIVRATEEGKLYLSEEELERSPVKSFARID
jgi:hypothetical protein